MKPARVTTFLPLLLGLLLLLGACGPRPPAPIANRTAGAPPPPASYSVRRGDTLYSIAWQYGLDHRQIAVWNGIGAPYTIYPGQRLALRKPTLTARRAPPPAPARAPVRPQPATAPPRPAAPASRPPPATPIAKPQPAAPAPKPVPQQAAPSRPPPRSDPAAPSTTRNVGGLAWRWPTRGRLYRTFNASDPARRGVDIVGSEGQPVYAAANGRVVYSGNGLVGYGNLVIIKHNDTYLSAYGHNRELLVVEGDEVAAGQLIAKMGKVDNDRAMLHFEIRRQGQPIDPLRLLPQG
jgi:lipoprotein NlpD